MLPLKIDKKLLHTHTRGVYSLNDGSILKRQNAILNDGRILLEKKGNQKYNCVCKRMEKRGYISVQSKRRIV